MNNPNLDLKYQIYLKSSLKLQRSYIKSTLKHHYNREKSHVTMVAKFLDDNNREFLQRLRQTAKNNRFRFRGRKRIHDIVRKEKGT